MDWSRYINKEWTNFKWVSVQSLITVYVKYSKMKLIAGVNSLRSFWQKWNFVSGEKYYVHTTPKWNHPTGNIYTCEYLIIKKIAKIVEQKIKTKMNFISFQPQWKLMQTYFFHGETKVNFRSHLEIWSNFILMLVYNIHQH